MPGAERQIQFCSTPSPLPSLVAGELTREGEEIAAVLLRAHVRPGTIGVTDQGRVDQICLSVAMHANTIFEG